MPGPARFDGAPPPLPSGERLPRLVAVDVDGTLLGQDKRVSARTRAALDALRARGTRVVLATGRPLRTAWQVAEEAGATETVVAYNGAAMWHAGEFRVLGELEARAADAAVCRLRDVAPGAILALEAATGWFLDSTTTGSPPGSEGSFVPQGNLAHLFRAGPPQRIGPLEEFLPGSRIKLLAVTEDPAPNVLARSLEDLDLYATWSLPFLLELHHPRVDKSSALARLCEELGVLPEEVAAFGDQHNDSGMLEWAGLGVAMGNAEPEALEAADLVTASNLEDGVALIIESWLRAAGKGGVPG